MPAWSTEVGREMVLAASGFGISLNQLQLQKLIYIAHGWCLASTGEPLTGDRPDADKFGPVYARLAELLRPTRLEPVTIASFAAVELGQADASEMELIALTLREYGSLSTAQLAVVTQGQNTPWSSIYANGSGEGRDIPHALVRNQFRELGRASGFQAAAR
ncbi:MULTISPECIES: Panacea domain-containing protein [Sphingomonas]|uniref:Panacea domain-containing protein n=1 Tax=Sphingomonas TaxID=13687 RepID=UPI000DEF5E6F|nr:MULTISPECIES: type II toxin-antitoxin system antitoxin SocA domain-containing protein [Sphingomonas]